MYKLNIDTAVKKMTANEIRDFIYENHHQRIGFGKENSYYSKKHQKKRQDYRLQLN